jgi:hypothetical protein
MAWYLVKHRYFYFCHDIAVQGEDGKKKEIITFFSFSNWKIIVL